MAYIATWLHGEEVVIEEEFSDLLEAQAHILRHLEEYFERTGADAVKVSDGDTIFFGIAA